MHSESVDSDPDPGRKEIPLNEGWTFTPGKAGKGWLACRGGRFVGETVSLPHCWNATDTFQFGRDYRKGHGSYRRAFRVPAEARGPEGRWVLQSDGFYGLAEIWLDGHRVARLDGQYLGFEVDLADRIRPDTEHRLGIRLTNACPKWVLPGYSTEPDFVLYGGLVGELRLRRLPASHLVHGATRIECRDALGGFPRVRIDAALANRSNDPLGGALEWSIVRDDDGAEVARHRVEVGQLPPGGKGTESVELTLEQPDLWSPEHPHLYRAVSRWVAAGEEVDRGSWTFGVRDAEFRPDAGFFLNGERTELRGANRHESMPGFGSALPAVWHRRDAEILKGLGLNFVRLSHYPQHPRFLDACDRLGLMVFPEIATWKSVRGGRWLSSAKRQMRGMILRDRNHPSVVLWGMGNESRDRRAYLELRGIARELDPSRPVTYAENHLYRARRKKTLGIPDVWGINYELDVLEAGRDASALRSVLISECMNHPASVRGDWGEEATQLATIQRDQALLENKPWVAGFAIWSFNDYATAHRKRYRRLPGLVDPWRLPKMSASLFAASYGEGPVLELFGDWGERPEGEGLRTVHVISNGGGVTVEHGGEIVASLPEGCRHREIRLAPGSYPGPLVARGRFGEQERTAELPWHGPPVGLELRPEADAVDDSGTLAVDVRVTDGDGHTVTSWNGDVVIRSVGPLRPRTYDGRGHIWISRGTGRGFVTATGGAGDGR
ncbi:MAG: glycoside hydrolase family 2 TIM barrel-domain containing protein, partial [Acidobacteriota bacterium]